MNTIRPLAALVSFALALLLTACGGGGDAGDDGTVQNHPVPCEARPELCR